MLLQEHGVVGVTNTIKDIDDARIPVAVIAFIVFQVITKESAGFRTRSTWGSPPFVYSIRSLIDGELVDTSAKYCDYFKNHILPWIEVIAILGACIHELSVDQ